MSILTKWAVAYLRSVFPAAYMTEEERVRAAIARDSARAITRARLENASYRGADRVLDHPDGRRFT